MKEATAQENFHVLNQASVNVAHASGPADVDTLLLSYPTAVLKANYPPLGNFKQPALSWRIPAGDGNNRLIMRCAMYQSSGTDVDGGTVITNLWLNNGESGNLLALSLIWTGGTGDITVNPVTQANLTGSNWGYADTVAVTVDAIEGRYYKRGVDGNNGVIEICVDLWGSSSGFIDFDCDDGGGEDTHDAIVLGRFW